MPKTMGSIKRHIVKMVISIQRIILGGSKAEPLRADDGVFYVTRSMNECVLYVAVLSGARETSLLNYDGVDRDSYE
jgi:hypothetical protein